LKAILAVLFFVVSEVSSSSPRIPNFDRAVALEDKAETTANASLGDLNADGYLDIVLAKGRHWPLIDLVLLNDGKGHFNRRHNVSDRADRTYTAALADLDGDGDLDLVVGNDAPDEKVIYFNEGKGHFTLAGTFGDARWPMRNVTVVDLNRDGRPDIVVANRSEDKPGANYSCLNDGHGYFPSCRAFSTESATTIAAADINGDGVPDLVVPHRDDGQSYIYINDGKGGFAEKHPFGPANAETRAIALGDLNGDGRLDIIIGDQARGGAFMYFNQGDMRFSDPVPIDKIDTIYSIAIADLNGDGRADIVLGNSEAPGVVLINDGTGRTFTTVRFGDKQGTVYGLAIGDVNGDGSLDIVAARSDAPNMLYLNSLVMKGARKRPRHN
jgi:VCBS repeat protein